MPGVVVTTATRSGPSAPVRATSGQLFVVGLAERGSTVDPIRISGMADYQRYLGGRVTYGALYDALDTFFAEGGTRAYVARVVGPAATTGSVTLTDRAATPLSTLRIDAASPGAFSSNIAVEVQNGQVPNTFRLIIRESGVIVADANNLASPSAAASAFALDPYVRVTDLGSASASPASNPAVVPSTALAAGNDDRASVTATMLVTALGRFNILLGDGAVAIPGQPLETVAAGIDAHCRINRRVGILAGARGESISSLTTKVANLNTEYCGVFAPWVYVPDEIGGRRAISPEGYVAGCRNRAHEEQGPWRAPAGRIAVARRVIGVDQSFSLDEANALDSARVSAIRAVANTVRLYGWRSLSLDTQNYAYLTGRDLLNRLVTDAEQRLEDYVFQTIDGKGRLLAAVNAELVGMCEPIRALGGLFELVDGEGNTIDPGYRVDTGQNVNSIASLANNEIRARLAIRISPIGALVSLVITKVGVTASI